MSRPSLTKHQREVYERCKRRHEHRLTVSPGRVAGFTSREMPQRVLHAVFALRRNDGPMIVVSNVGSAGALRHLADKGYLAVLIEDATTPVYVFPSVVTTVTLCSDNEGRTLPS